MMDPAQVEVPFDIMNEYSQMLLARQHRIVWRSMQENELWYELVRCILSSNVPYELAVSAWTHLRDSELIDPARITSSTFSRCYETISSDLKKSIYLPKKKDGSYRKYRFPNVRARDIVDAALFLYSQNLGLRGLLEQFSSETDARDFLRKNVSGVGMKEASHFLRDIGYADSLAIVDSHIISFLREMGVAQIQQVTLTPKRYEELEQSLRKISSDRGLNLAVFDMAIWRCMKGSNGH